MLDVPRSQRAAADSDRRSASVWFLPPGATLLLAVVAAGLAVVEYCALAKALGIAGAAGHRRGHGGRRLCRGRLRLRFRSTASCSVDARWSAGRWQSRKGSRRPGCCAAAAATFGLVYIGVPLGAVAAVRTIGGREAVLLLMATIVVSDSAQYYTGRAFGRAPLAPSISPKKTREGAIGGLVFGTAAMIVGGRYVFPADVAGRCWR